MTGKRSAGSPRELMRQDYLHYITDVVVELEGRMYESAFTRLIRIVKYRGSGFAGNAFPAVITSSGFEVIAKTKARLNYPVFTDRLTSGVPGIDALLGGGYRRGTATLVSGAPGTAKTSLAGSFALASCRNGETVVYVSLDESDSQIVYDLQTIGIDLEPHRAAGRLVIVSLRAASVSPDRHFVEMRRLLDEHRPSVFIIDPITALIMENYPFAMQVCENLLDEARWRGMTAFCTSLSGVSINDQELSISNLSTIADTWLHLTYNSRGGERNRAFTIVKSRGTPHSNQVRELLIDNAGLKVVEAYSVEGEVLMGSARAEKENEARQRILDLKAKLAREEFEMAKSLANLEAQSKSVLDQIEWKRAEIDLLRQEATNSSENLRREAERRQLRREAGRQE
jgi:circadian clock protein KaiC